MGLLRFLPASRQGFLSALADQADHASIEHRRREVIGRGAGAASQAGSDRRDGYRAEEHGALGARREAERNYRSVGKVSVKFAAAGLGAVTRAAVLQFSSHGDTPSEPSAGA